MDSGMVHGAAILNNLTIKFIVPQHAYPRGALVVKEIRRGEGEENEETKRETGRDLSRT